MANSVLSLVAPQLASSALGNSQWSTRKNIGIEDKVSVRRISSAACCTINDHSSGGIFSKREGLLSEGRKGIQVKAIEPTESSPTATTNSILCKQCDGNGAIVCSQCKGDGINKEDFFNGQFKAGTICWLCRGKREILCGNCNGAGFLGGFMNSFEDS